MSIYVCPYCGESIGKNFRRYLRHIRFVHSNEPNFSISCIYCEKSFKKFTSFKSHLQRKHQEQLHENNALVDEVNHEPYLSGSDNDNDPDHQDQAHEQRNDDQVTEPEGIDDTSIENITKFIALFVLQTKEVNMVSQQAIDSILDNTKTLVEHCLETLTTDVKSCLAQNGLNWTEIDGLSEVFDNKTRKYQKALDPVATEYLQVKYMVEKLNYVVSYSN